MLKDNPFETIAAITAAAPLFFSPVPQEGETEEDFAQRKVDVTNYLRQYGSNFYSGKDLDDFISRTTSNLGYAQGGRVGFAAGSGGYESFKDFIEDTGDEEIMDVYIDVFKRNTTRRSFV